MLPETMNIQQQLLASKKHGRKLRLPQNYSPSKHAVLCGRGSKCTKSPGNKRLKQLVQTYLKPYSEAKNKVEKSSIVSAIITSVKEDCPDGAFVKYEEGVWWEVEDAFAREKIGCLFRDCLHTQYRSSTKAKLARKKATADCASVDDDDDDVSLPMIRSSQQQISSHNDSVNASQRTSKSVSALEPPTSGRVGHGNIDLSLSMDDIFGKDFNSNAFNNNKPLGNCVDTHAQTNPTKSLPSKPMKLEDYSCLLGGNYTNGRVHRQDFMRDCMPAATNFVVSSDPLEQAPRTKRQSHTSSLLRAACDIVGGPKDSIAGVCNITDNDDLPDDLSDIFEDEDTEDNNNFDHQSFFAV